jgi:hypothetical protein
MADRSAQAEIAKVESEGRERLSVAAQAVGLEDHRRMLSAYNQRLADSHRAQMKAMGLDSLADAAGDGTEVGNIFVTGDITHTYAKPPDTTAPQAPQQANGMSGAAKAIITALGLATAGGGVGAGIYQGLKAMKPDAVDPAKYELHLLPPDATNSP